jgi:hypothetical protein
MKQHGGKRAGSGRKKGTPNKVTKDVREAIINAFDMVGGADYLVKIAKEDPKAFCTLLGKTVPVKVGGDEQNPIQISLTVDRPPDETRDQWLARRSRELGLGAVMGATARPANGRDHS